MKKLAACFLLFIPLPLGLMARESASTKKDLSVKWEELSAPEFLSALDKAAGTCLIPLGILEKHGPHLPMGTDLIPVRETAIRAAGNL